jgi:hypothetical protein
MVGIGIFTRSAALNAASLVVDLKREARHVRPVAGPVRRSAQTTLSGPAFVHVPRVQAIREGRLDWRRLRCSLGGRGLRRRRGGRLISILCCERDTAGYCCRAAGCEGHRRGREASSRRCCRRRAASSRTRAASPSGNDARRREARWDRRDAWRRRGECDSHHGRREALPSLPGRPSSTYSCTVAESTGALRMSSKIAGCWGAGSRTASQRAWPRSLVAKARSDESGAADHPRTRAGPSPSRRGHTLAPKCPPAHPPIAPLAAPAPCTRSAPAIKP